MDDKPQSDDRRRGSAPVLIAAAVIGFLCLPLLYVLSLGPAVWLVEGQYLPLDLAQWFYWPLEALVERFDFVRGILTWYVELFR